MFELLHGLSQQEFKKLGEFIKSPYHNKSTNVIRLYDMLNKKYSIIREQNLSVEDISSFIYNEKGGDSSRVRSLISDFAKLVEKFLILTEWEKNEIYQKTLLLTSLNQRNIIRTFNSTLNETLAVQEAEFNRDEDYYYNMIFLEVESFNYNL